ncbi:endonuclease SmrB [Avibacterium paragallinarum]|uniref:endonuclease SmrB n=1 Tax=Avibacterium paragallinarum TaxID=728 RepID=UPI00021AD419|nr:endonuclease SmrB [Avibacterium paragallinarum]QIR11757.1 endonuclease SmrB [Avibacterium paragallinarum]QJE09271.1 endonuclease SmrB [Avibacterium paragallinarum]QJE11467.1 endonuclease SmrB [Avibacterium paragallinarum]QJE13666.1 endonuclease SmrB [Avibacterium paragallinarum]QJE15866.1 endonuclease SmrB [Avibacterium paragallinarum]
MLKDEDLVLFRDEVQGIKPLKQNEIIPVYKKPNPNQRLREQREKEDTLFFFSDDYEPLLNEEGGFKYLRSGEDSYLLKQLRRGDFSPEIFLDLHGLTREQAKLELVALLQACEREHIYCASIMTGYGTYTLKRQIPRWLVQYPRVRALHQAPKEWGGEAAILVLLDV